MAWMQGLARGIAAYVTAQLSESKTGVGLSKGCPPTPAGIDGQNSQGILWIY